MPPLIWSILLLLVALTLGFLELFIPSGGVLAIGAVLALIGCLIFAFSQGMVFGLILLVVIVVGLPFFVWYMLKIWQSTPIGRRMLLDPSEDPALAPNEEIERHKALVGKTGTAKSLMMPGGIIEIEGHTYDAVSEGLPIDPGTLIAVVYVDGINLTVRPIANENQVPSTASEQNPDASADESKIEDPFAQ